ncbi:hypothetical protein VNO78_03989 [Psophocarpus tetragonolobus]|uniref:Uncharacterized protein n=1 Tax=Psophocarpus tetragonolobus TaxID=3891 RepID=A0AAN9T351_PSOTE
MSVATLLPPLSSNMKTPIGYVGFGGFSTCKTIIWIFLLLTPPPWKVDVRLIPREADYLPRPATHNLVTTVVLLELELPVL